MSIIVYKTTNSLKMQEYKIKIGFENMDIDSIHHFLSTQSYWAKGISFEIVKESLRNSFCIGTFYKNKQVGFARLITDYATFAYLADVYVIDAHRRKGISKMMIKHMMDQEWTNYLRRLLLATLDAHSLYSQFGYLPLKNPERFMEINRPDIYITK